MRSGTGQPDTVYADGGGAARVFTPPARLALLAAFAVLVLLRLPQASLHGRFLNEEGTIFFAYAWHRPALEALFRSFGGYLNLGANASTVAVAHLVRTGAWPLERAPCLTMLIALIFQLLPAILILTARARWLGNRRAVVAALLVIAIGPRTEEVFLNVLHIQFHLALCAALILALDVPASVVARVGYWALLILAPLCGPGAIVLMPFFALRSLIDRDLARIGQTAALAIGTALQLLLFFTPSPVRGQFLDPATLAAILFVRLVAMPFLTTKPAGKLGHLVYTSYSADGLGWWCAAAAMLAYGAALAVLAVRGRRDGAIWLIAPGLAIAVVSFGGGMIVSGQSDWFSVGAGERYNFLPLTLTSLGLIVLAERPGGRYRRVCAGLCALTLVSGATAYAKPIKELRQGPEWSREVAIWRRDHDYLPAGWSQSWRVDLSDRDRPCTRPAPGAAAAGDPSYCEDAWLARVAHPVPGTGAKR